MSCLGALSISALFGSIASGASGIFNSVRGLFGRKKQKKEININSNNTNTTEIGNIAISNTLYL